MIAVEARRRTGLSRVTLVGERRRIDLVLPSDEPVGRLLPDVMELLGDRIPARPMLRHLVTSDGTVLAPDATLAAAHVPDGAVLRLVRVQDAPSAPVVHDVTDEVADDLDVRPWRWGPQARRATAGLIAVGWTLVAALLARHEFAADDAGPVLAGSAAPAALIGALAGRARRRGLATTLIVAAGVLGVLGAWTLGDAHAWSGAERLAAVAAVAVITLALLGWCSPLGRGGLVGAGAAAGAAGCWEAAIAFNDAAHTATDQARVGALLAVVSVVVLGVLPRLALMASGLAALDDRRSAGTSVSRYEVSTALSATHRALALATCVCAVSGATAGVLALRTPTVWTVLLTAAVAVAVLLRSRAFPLVVEVVVLLLAGAVLGVRLVTVWLAHADPAGPLAVATGLAVLPLLVLAVRPAEHVRVRLRRMGDVVESFAVIALLPLVIGVFGVYGRLLDTFA
ncbi:EsaB/YukD family protein [Streptomyces sp. 796.1]|uniref:EsaB/YukD family protein n=1 Tax=Streptomyces sp. 796.1 TaxID=3163029 RepID=UPI0039C9B675